MERSASERDFTPNVLKNPSRLYPPNGIRTHRSGIHIISGKIIELIHCVTDYYAHLLFCCKPGSIIIKISTQPWYPSSLWFSWEWSKKKNIFSKKKIKMAGKKFWELAILKNELFLSRPFWIFFFDFFFFFFCFIIMKISPNLNGRMDGSKFWCFPWFPENSLLCVILRYTV